MITMLDVAANDPDQTGYVCELQYDGVGGPRKLPGALFCGQCLLAGAPRIVGARDITVKIAFSAGRIQCGVYGDCAWCSPTLRVQLLREAQSLLILRNAGMSGVSPAQAAAAAAVAAQSVFGMQHALYKQHLLRNTRSAFSPSPLAPPVVDDPPRPSWWTRFKNLFRRKP